MRASLNDADVPASDVPASDVPASDVPASFSRNPIAPPASPLPFPCPSPPPQHPEHTTYLVFDRCERLRDFKPTLLAALLRLPELTNRNICCMFISTLVWSKFQCGSGMADPYQVHVPAYDKAATVAILGRRCPQGVPQAFFERFVELMWDVFHGPCRDLNELGHLVTLLFPAYRRPVDEEEVAESNVATLYKRIAPLLKDQLSKLYLRETSTAEWKARNAQQAEGEEAQGPVSARLELPFHAKYLLLAAYIASHNPARTDQQFFARVRRWACWRFSAEGGEVGRGVRRLGASNIMLTWDWPF